MEKVRTTRAITPRAIVFGTRRIYSLATLKIKVNNNETNAHRLSSFSFVEINYTNSDGVLSNRYVASLIFHFYNKSFLFLACIS